MRKLINGKIRDTEKMVTVLRNEGDPNHCYSTYKRVMWDPRDGTHYLWGGYFSAGLGPDSLELLEDPITYIEKAGWSLSIEDSAYIEKLLKGR